MTLRSRHPASVTVIAAPFRLPGYSDPRARSPSATSTTLALRADHPPARTTRSLGAGLPAEWTRPGEQRRVYSRERPSAGREWQPKGEPERVDVHDFPTDAIGKAIPYGVYDVAAVHGFVNVGVDHDTPKFAVTSIESWWHHVGAARYPDAHEIFITADAGGSNSYRARAWKYELQGLADKLGLSFRVSHLPPGTSKWNKIEHRLFSFISINWRGRPLRTYETIVETIGHTTHRGGLVVHAQLDDGSYPLGQKVSPKDFRALNIERDDFCGDWNYTIRPRTR